MIRRIDQRAKGRGYAIAQIKVVRKNGNIEYHYSRPNLKWNDLLGWAWYWAHRRDLKRGRNR